MSEDRDQSGEGGVGGQEPQTSQFQHLIQDYTAALQNPHLFPLSDYSSHNNNPSFALAKGFCLDITMGGTRPSISACDWGYVHYIYMPSPLPPKEDIYSLYGIVICKMIECTLNWHKQVNNLREFIDEWNSYWAILQYYFQSQ